MVARVGFTDATGFQSWRMCEEVLFDELWARLKPLIPAPPRRFGCPDRQRVSDRAALAGILYVVRVGVGWKRLQTRLFGASGAKCW
jgi:transposase